MFVGRHSGGTTESQRGVPGVKIGSGSETSKDNCIGVLRTIPIQPLCMDFSLLPSPPPKQVVPK